MLADKFGWMSRPLIAFAVIGAVAVSVSFWPSPWLGWAPDPCRAVNCFCEPLRPGLVAQPVAAYSNLAFVLVGLLILAAPPGNEGTPNLMSTRRAYPRTYAAACLVIGFGSFFYHASLTRAGEWLDLVGMYLLASFLLLYNLARLRPVPGWLFILTYLALNGVMGIQMLVARELQQAVFGALISSAVVLESLNWLRYRPRARYGYLAGALACFGIGALLWTLSGTLPCVPESLLQWHAVWHLLAAVAALLLFGYYRSEMEG